MIKVAIAELGAIFVWLCLKMLLFLYVSMTLYIFILGIVVVSKNETWINSGKL